jgi:hypothetical protein
MKRMCKYMYNRARNHRVNFGASPRPMHAYRAAHTYIFMHTHTDTNNPSPPTHMHNIHTQQTNHPPKSIDPFMPS